MKPTTLDYDGEPVRITRRGDRPPRIAARHWAGALFGLGWLHGRHRGAQIETMRRLGQGRLCESLRDDGASLAADVHYRRLGLARDAEAAVGALEHEALVPLTAYCMGLNGARRARQPLGLRVAGHRPEPFAPADALLLLKLLAYTGLAEGQRAGELFVVHAVRRGLRGEQARALFPHLGPLDEETLQALHGVPALGPGEVPYGGGSNAWAVHGSRTVSGAAVLANDPHLEVNRLPPLLYEAELVTDTGWAKGATIPGVPGMMSARTRDLAWGVTYTCAHTSDFFVEECRDGRYRYGHEWFELDTRREAIRRKSHTTHEIDVYTNHHGVLEGDPYRAGYHLCWRWVGMGDGGLGTLTALPRLLGCRSLAEAEGWLGRIDIPTLHVVLADSEGNIGYRFTGAVPKGAGDSGLAPLPGWRPDRDWQGHIETHELPSVTNPSSGRLVTANEPRETRSGVALATWALAPYRYRRIERRLAAHTHDAASAQRLQCDCTSLQVERLLPLYLPYVPPGPERALLAGWSGDYATDSEAATLFENIHRGVLVEVFGRVLGRAWLRWLLRETGLAILGARYFDDVLRRRDPCWLPEAEREGLIARGVRQGLAEAIEPWGRRHHVTFKNLFFGTGLLGWLGADRGPCPLPGNHATPRQGSVVRLNGREAVIAACYRLVTDMAGPTVWSAVPGGACEVPGTRGYRRELARWLRGRYKAF